MKFLKFMVIVLVLVGFLCGVGVAAEKEKAQKENAQKQTQTAQLTNADCIKCHPNVVHQIESAGGKHKTDVTCLDCHEGGHPPLVPKEKIIPQCSKCHQGEEHFTLPNCLDCHKNPHEPLNITFPENTKAACKTCHSQQVQEVNEHPSAHSKVDCSFCHTKHRYIPDCLDCHEPHREGQQFAECVKCHPVHMPLNITYGMDIPNADCGACHGDIQKTLESGTTKHAKLACVYCHRGVHGVIPPCEACHGKPHPKAMLEKYKSCLDCHQDAHNLVK